MTGFRTYPGEHIIFSEGGVASFELGSNPTYGEGILTKRALCINFPLSEIHRLILFSQRDRSFLPINEVKCFGFEDDLLFIEVDHGKDQAEVRTSVDWLTAWQKRLVNYTVQPHEVENGRWEVAGNRRNQWQKKTMPWFLWHDPYHDRCVFLAVHPNAAHRWAAGSGGSRLGSDYGWVGIPVTAVVGLGFRVG